MKFINSVISDFTEESEDELLIPTWLFDDRIVKTIRLPYCFNNESASKKFINTLEQYTKHKFKFIVIWETRDIRTLFPLKDRVQHKSSVIYEGICTCEATYIGETNRVVTIRLDEHNNKEKDSEPSRHLKKYPHHSFTWSIKSPASKFTLKRKILEAFYIAKYKPSLNEQIKSSTLTLFRHGIT